jgi:hypothetical protein
MIMTWITRTRPPEYYEVPVFYVDARGRTHVAHARQQRVQPDLLRPCQRKLLADLQRETWLFRR